VASLVDVPEGQEGRPSSAMTLNQAVMLLETVVVGHSSTSVSFTPRASVTR
jgi:hypothetical protein